VTYIEQMTYINVNDTEQMIEDENISTIFLDVDGVVIDSVRAIVRILNRKYGTKCKSSDIISWNFSQVKSNLTDKEIEDIFNDDSFFDIVMFYDGVLDFIRRYKDKIIFLTKGGIENISGKHDLFNDNEVREIIGNIPLIGLPLNISKGYINMKYKGRSLFIDDCSQNLIDSNADIKILYREYNNNADWQQDWAGWEMKGWE